MEKFALEIHKHKCHIKKKGDERSEQECNQINVILKDNKLSLASTNLKYLILPSKILTWWAEKFNSQIMNLNDFKHLEHLKTWASKVYQSLMFYGGRPSLQILYL